MGMAGGAFKGDTERAKLALQARQIANQSRSINNQHEQALRAQRLREQELASRDAARAQSDANTNRELDMRQQMIDANTAHQERQDALAARTADRAAERADALLQQRLAQQNKVYGGYEQLARQSKAQQQQRQEQGASAVASVMKLAMKSGGTDPKTGKVSKGAVPMYALQALNRDMGFDGENQGFVSGGYTSNGDFYLQYAQKDPQTGQIVTTPQIMKPIDQYKVMHQQQGIFDNNDRGTMAAQLKQAGFRDDEILLASGINQTQLEQMRKLAAAQQSKDSTIKDRLSGLSVIKDFLDKNIADLDEQTAANLKGAYQNGVMQIASQFAPKAPEPGVNAPTLNNDGTLTLPNGQNLRKDQEYTNPQDGKKYIWRGGDAKNWEAIENGGENGGGQQTQQPQGDSEQQKYQRATTNNDAFDALNPEGMPGREAKLISQGGYQPEGPDQEPGVGPRVSNLPEGGDNSQMEAMFNRLKAKGIIDKDMTLEDFIQLQEDDPEGGEGDVPAGGGEGGGGGE